MGASGPPAPPRGRLTVQCLKSGVRSRSLRRSSSRSMQPLMSGERLAVRFGLQVADARRRVTRADPFEDPDPWSPAEAREPGGKAAAKAPSSTTSGSPAALTGERSPTSRLPSERNAAPSTLRAKSPSRTSSWPSARVASMNARRASSLIGKSSIARSRNASLTSRWSANGLRQISSSTRAPGRSTSVGLAEPRHERTPRLEAVVLGPEVRPDDIHEAVVPGERLAVGRAHIRRAEPARHALELPAPGRRVGAPDQHDRILDTVLVENAPVRLRAPPGGQQARRLARVRVQLDGDHGRRSRPGDTATRDVRADQRRSM